MFVSTAQAQVSLARDLNTSSRNAITQNNPASPRTDAFVPNASDIPSVEPIGPVRGRSRPDYDPMGVRWGSFVFLPSVISSAIWDSNVYASRTNREEDMRYVLSPRLSIQSDWPTHALAIDLGADISRYGRLSSEDRDEFGAQLKHRLDILQNMNLVTTLRAARLFEARGSNNAVFQAFSPTPYDSYLGDVTLNQTFNRFGYALGVNIQRNDYESVGLTNGQIFNQRFRSGDISTVSFRPFYEFSPGYRAFLQAQYNWRDYQGVGINDRGSEGYNIQGGVEFEVTRLLSGQVGLGYLGQDYRNPLLRSSSGLAANAVITWNPTPLMTVRAGIDRQITDGVSTFSSGQLATSTFASIDYELLRNLIVSLGGRYTFYDNTGATSEDNLGSVTVQADYLINRMLSAGISYSYEQRETNGIPDQSYNRNLVGVYVKAQY
jgi:hypothetical protein